MSFDTFGLNARLLTNIANMGITTPTPIQTQAIPHAMEGRDVMGLAQTGTGKTAAFGLPMLHRLISDGRKTQPKSVRALVLAPTRELAKQIHDNLTAFHEGSHLKSVLVVGGAGIVGQMRKLERGTSILVATPGRLIDLIDRNALRLDQTDFLVLDEADQMLDLGFIHALRRIAEMLPKQRQTMLFSATMPKQMAELAQSYLTDAVRVQVNPPGQAADKIEQSVHYVAKAAKFDLLVELLDQHRDDLALVFGRTKWGMEKLGRMLESKGFAVASIHGNKSQGQRDRAIKDFKEGTVRILVATDVAARGIDIPGVKFVYNFELPNVPDQYVHRIGRTARAGAEGQAVALVAPDEMADLKEITKLLKTDIATASGRPWENYGDAPKPKPQGQRRGNGGQGKPTRNAHGGSGKPNGGQGKRPAGNAQGGGMGKQNPNNVPRRGGGKPQPKRNVA